MTVKRVLITAGASGIGRSMAQGFSMAGYKVWIADADARSLADCPAEWKQSLCDISDEISVQALFRDINSEWGGLDVLCANAGIAGPTAKCEDVSLADWKRCLDINLDGTFLTCREVIAGMKNQRSGVILLTASTAGIYGFPNRAPYAASKWAMNGLMKTLAMELGPFGIRVNSICPGSVEGPRMEAVLAKEAAIKGTTRDAIYRGYADGTSMKNFVAADDIANMAVFLASDGARFVSGQIIAVDGHTENPDPKI
jgi:NAD(P)-dependent dehydrogenase (short-subunit alcohol dehydrogenase family)